ncbi:MAG: hypothetical protein ACRD3A_07925 [Terriglobales bacterium]
MAKGYALDREAFTFTRYDLEVHVAPARQWLETKGRITLRNDSAAPQRVATLQISSSLDWISIRAGGKPVQFLTQSYVSDVDHTGSLSEALITLPQPVAPGQAVELEIAYAGIIPADSTRLRRIGAPAAVAARNDWDQIGESFTAVRGLGYVAWYPVALEATSLSEGNEVFETIGRWQQRHAKSEARLDFCVQYEVPTPDASWPILNGEETPSEPAPAAAAGGRTSAQSSSTCRRYQFASLQVISPTFAVGKYKALSQPPVEVDYLPGQQAIAGDYPAVAATVAHLLTDWFGPIRGKLRIVELGQPEAAPYESGAVLFLPLRSAERKSLEVALAHSLTHAAFDSPRLWITEGAAHFAQALQTERQGGRAAALTYMESQRPALAEAEAAAPDAAPEAPAAAQSLVNSADAVFYRTKAMYVFWMLRDLIGDAALQRALKSYRALDDKAPAYLQTLVEAEAKKSLEWFFDDWVYRDRGLPDFRIAATYPRPTLEGSFGVTVTVENLGSAGAEVPVTVRSEHGQVSERVLVPAHGKGVARILIPAKPKEASVNDGSVPESDLSNNSAPIPEKPQ